jgi:beta-lactamase regulating signal transducer with metallopeptidase domain
METLTATIIEFLKGQSIQVAIVFTGVLILTWFLRNKSAHVRYLLWLLVAVKCLTPPLVSFSVPVLPPETAAVVTSVQPAEIDYQPIQNTVISITSDQVQPHQQNSIESRESKIENSPIARLHLTSTGVLLSAWTAGAACYLLWALGKAVRLGMCLRRIRKPLPAQLMIEQIELLTRLWNHPGGFNVWLVDGISQPFVWGLWRGAIYLPTRFQSIQSDKQKAIVIHEMAHVVRLDAFVNLIQILIQGVFWFHPLVWLANRAIRQEREKCCDEIAVARLGTAPREYGSAIVDTLLQEAEAGLAIPTLAVAGPVKNIEDRIKTIMQPGRRFFHRPSTIALLIIGLLAIIIIPTTIALTQKPTPPDYTLSGSVTNAESGQPIAGAIVYDDGYGPQPYQKGITGADGKFEYKSWNEEHNVAAKADGYQQQTMAFMTFPFDNSKNLNFKLQPGEKTEVKIETEKHIDRVIMTLWKTLLKEGETYFIDFDTRQMATRVDEVNLKDEESVKKWVRDNGYDAVVKFGEHPQLIGYDTAYLLVGSSVDDWEDMSAVWIYELTRQKQLDTATYHNGQTKYMKYALRTREGAIGWLRMATIDDKHPQSMVFEFNKLDDEYAKTKLAAFRKEQSITQLSFHILPSKEATGQSSTMLSQEQIADYRMQLRTNGPAYGATQKDEYRWLKSDHPQRPLPLEAITEEYSGMRYVLVCNWQPRAMLSGSQYPENWSLTKVEMETDTLGHPAIRFELDEVGQEQMAMITGSHLGLSMAIVLNGNVIAAPRIQSKLSKQGMIVGSFTEDEVRQIVDLLKTSPRYKPSASIQPPAETQTPDPNTTNFSAILPNGVTVELIGIRERPVKVAPWWKSDNPPQSVLLNKEWWQPDGLPLAQQIITQDDSHYEDKNKAYEIAYRISMPQDVTMDMLPKTKGSTAQSGLTVKSSADIKAYRTHLDLWGSTTDISFPIAAGPWKTLGTTNGTGQINSPVGSRKLMFSPAIGSHDKFTLTVTDDLQQFDDYRLIAVDKQGNNHTGSRAWFSVDNTRQNTFTFTGLDPATVDRYEFQSRLFSNIEFKNVSLKPGKKTGVKIEIPADLKEIQISQPDLKFEEWVNRIASLKTHNETAFAVMPALITEDSNLALQAAQAAWPKISIPEVKQGILKAFHFARHPEDLTILNMGVHDPHVEVVSYALTYVADYSGVKFPGFGEEYLQWYEKNKDIASPQIQENNNQKGNPQADKIVQQMIDQFGQGGGRTGNWDYATRLGYLKYEPAIPALIGVIDADNSYDTIYGTGWFALTKITGVPYSPFHDGAWWRRWWEKNKVRYPESIRNTPIPELPKTATGRKHVPYPEDIDTAEGLIRWTKDNCNTVPSYPGWSDVAQEFAAMQDPRAIPYLIEVMQADISGRLIYDLGYFGLQGLTGVPYDQSHNAQWWKDWWETNRSRYPQEVQKSI